MSPDFDTIIDRTHSHSTKWNKYQGRDILPMWVADMDFRSPEPVIEALAARVRHGVFGYTEAPEALTQAIVDRLAARYDWHIAAEDIVYISGVVPGLNVACRAFAASGAGVLTVVPIYPPFMSAPEFAGSQLIRVEAEYEGGRWRFPMEAFESAAARDEAKLFLLCNPWNPVGRMLGREELEQIVDICIRHGVTICSDEIHCDLVFDSRVHVPTASLGADAAAHTVTLMAPSKTFNLAGFGGSFAVIQDPSLRQRFSEEMRGVVANVNIMAYESMLVAYRDCEDWYRSLIAYLQGNRDFLLDAFSEIGGITMNPVEATYLAFLDVGSLSLNDPPGFFENAGIGMSEGYRFGDDRFMRLNFGCPRSVLIDAISRFKRALAGR